MKLSINCFRSADSAAALAATDLAFASATADFSAVSARRSAITCRGACRQLTTSAEPVPAPRRCAFSLVAPPVKLFALGQYLHLKRKFVPFRSSISACSFQLNLAVGFSAHKLSQASACDILSETSNNTKNKTKPVTELYRIIQIFIVNSN